METASSSNAAAPAPDAGNRALSHRSMAADSNRFNALVVPALDDLHRFAYWLCSDQATAEDIVQEACLRAWRSLDRLREPRAVKSWLFTTLRREHARLYERRRLPIASDVEPATVAGDDDGPEGHLDRHRLRQAIHRLPLNYRTPLAMQVLFGCSVREIAQELELGESAVMARLFRARNKLMADFGADPLPAAAGDNRTCHDV